jgi:transcriptional regulator with XRE-family HTH domain
MKQPELGNKMSEIRNQKGITQKELSESCNIDIRTIQRIESGDVVPRMSTLKLIANALSCDFGTFNEDSQGNIDSYYSSKVQLSLFIVGVIYFIGWILFSPIIPKNNLLLSFNLLIAIIYTVAGVFFYYGFYNSGKLTGNSALKISSLIIMICIPLFLISVLISSEYGFARHFSQLIILLTGINSFVFGIGLMKVKSQSMKLYKITGILQLLIAPFFIIPIPMLSIIGCWLSIPFISLLLIIVFLEYREAKKANLSTETL